MSFKLFCSDIDGVLFHDKNFWMELHKSFGTLEEGKVLTKKYLESDYPRLVEEVVGSLWKGKPEKPYFALINSLEYIPGVEELFTEVRRLGYVTALVSASSLDVARRIQKEYGVDHLFANDLVLRDGVVSGDFVWPVGEGTVGKALIVRDLCDGLGISLGDVIYVGDSLKDIEVFKIVGRSIAFNSTSDALKEVATHVVDEADLRKIIPYLS